MIKKIKTATSRVVSRAWLSFTRYLRCPFEVGHGALLADRQGRDLAAWACITRNVNEELLLQNEYLVGESRIHCLRLKCRRVRRLSKTACSRVENGGSCGLNQLPPNSALMQFLCRGNRNSAANLRALQHQMFKIIVGPVLGGLHYVAFRRFCDLGPFLRRFPPGPRPRCASPTGP